MEENLTEEISKASEKKKVELQQMGTIGEIILEKRKGKLFLCPLGNIKEFFQPFHSKNSVFRSRLFRFSAYFYKKM